MSKLLCLLVLLFSPAAYAGVNDSGLPVPRFVSLRADEANIRTGPGTRYPIQWKYLRDGIPLEIIEEFDHWRKIRDPDGASGWVHQTMLSGERMAVVLGKTPHILRKDAEEEARGVIKVEPGVVARLLACTPQWCRIQVAARKGWLKKVYLWGAYPDESFD